MEHPMKLNDQDTNTSSARKTKLAISREVWHHPLYFIAFGFGSGLLPVMPGTCGTFFAIPFYLLLARLPWQLYASIVLIAFVVGIWLSDRAEEMAGIKDY